MFNSKDNNAKSNSSSTSNTNTNKKGHTLLGEGTTINGDIDFNGMLILDGTIVGSITGSQNDDVLTISESGFIEGKINVANIIVNGKIKGDITSTGKVEVASKANIEGNVYYSTIEMNTGSRINGQLIYQDDKKSNKISNIEDKKAK